MPSNSAASMFGGAGGRGAKASVSTLDGLRKVLGNQTEKDSAPIHKAAAKPVASQAPSAPETLVAPGDDKQTLRTLNNRLSGYLNRVKQLQEENDDLQKEIDDILAKRKVPEGRDWDGILKPLDNLKREIKDITDDNAKLLLQIDNSRLANEDFKNKLDDENKACKELEKDLEDLKRAKDDTKLSCDQTREEIKMVNDELERLKREHKKEVDSLLEKIKDSDVTVEIKSQDNNLSDVVQNVRRHYEKVAEKNLKEAEEWYKDKFETIKVEEAQNNEALESGKSELKDLQKQKQTLEIQIQTKNNKLRTVEQTLRNIKMEYGHRLEPSNKIILGLEQDLRDVREQVELQLDANKNLLSVKMKLEKELEQYQELLSRLFDDVERAAN
ncbi:keratin, type I cytoskeletal 18-like isoform X3 [Simochromis diagramma]|uniref:keratin, type I cytoskeletal 18-like isoform X3 n=1 Tax=Simochromis diagramma TaxID=43689 RepID=UPI001A7E38FF|nr:keratin, type I cytoskeletal 18-like isoform X3 [Simochromis diagramma]